MKRNIWDVSITVSVPAGMDKATVQKMLNQMLGEAESRCDDYLRQDETYVDSDIIESAKSIKESKFTVCDPKFGYSEGTDLECSVDCDEATFIGDEDDGCYYQVFEDGDGRWWLSVMVDCQTSGFSQSLADGDGPYDTERDAKQAGFNMSTEWCDADGVDWGNWKPEM